MVTTPETKDTFIWEGVNRQGKRIKGETASTDAESLRFKLLQQGINPDSIKKKRNPLLFAGRRKKVSASAISVFCRQLSTMISAGTPLVQALNIIATGEENETFKAIIHGLEGDVAQGISLSAALGKNKKQFDALFCNLVDVGEQSGTLDVLLNQIANYKEKMELIKKKIKKAMFYPVTVVSIALLVTAALLMFVVPQLAGLFNNFGKELPAFTQMVIDMSAFLQNYWWLILILLGTAITSMSYAKKKNPAFDYFLQSFILRIYIIGPILRKSIFARLMRTLSITISAGVPLVNALTSIAGVVGNKIYQDAVLQMRDEVATGLQLHIAMRNTGLFPNLMVQMIDIAEQSGKIEEILTKLASFYEEEVDVSVDALSSLIEPLIMLFLGVLVGSFVVAMYLPIFKLGSLF